jgi:hypothetical protein
VGEDEIAEAISTIIGETLTPQGIYPLDFASLRLTRPQLEQLANLLDKVSDVYLLHVKGHSE